MHRRGKWPPRRPARAVADKARGDAVQSAVSCNTKTPHLSGPEIIATLAARSHLHDLTIPDADIHAVALDRASIEAVVFYSGRPHIVGPAGRDTFAARRILVGWDGRREATRAINDARPFLRAAEAVEFVSVVGEKELSGSVADPSSRPIRHDMSHASGSSHALDGRLSRVQSSEGLPKSSSDRHQ